MSKEKKDEFVIKEADHFDGMYKNIYKETDKRLNSNGRFSFNNKLEMNTSTFIFNTIIMINILSISTTFNID